MSAYKMICLDIDGTLLNSKHKITLPVKNSIQKAAAEKNIPVILVSARMPKGIIFLQKELGIQFPIISYSGALILDQKQNILHQEVLSLDDVQSIYASAKKLQAHLSIYKENTWYIEKNDVWSKQESDITGIRPEIQPFDKLLTQWSNQKTGPNKLLFMADPKIIQTLKNLFSAKSITSYCSKPTYLEIVPNCASKTNAIKYLANIQSIATKEIITIGDNYNDIDMLESAGLGIAMDNAPDAVKSHADTITASNDNDGVAAAIEKYCLS
jgi:hypothetical protein